MVEMENTFLIHQTIECISSIEKSRQAVMQTQEKNCVTL